jgi:GWxTD domain-containing protein
MRFGLCLLATVITVTTALHLLPADCSDDMTSEDKLSELVAAYPDSAPLHVELAAAYYRRGTAKGRSLAAKVMNQALRLEPHNTDYHMLLAEIHFECTFWNYGVEELEHALEIDGSYGFARARLGEAYLESAIDEWQKDSFIKARDELRQVDSLHPSYRLAMRHLAQCYFDLGKPDSTIAALEGFPQDSLEVDDLLLLGMAHCERRDIPSSAEAFYRALEAMDEETRGRYTSMELLAGPEDLKRISEAKPAEADAQTALFWRKRDPNPATEVNERLIEHVARVAFADLHFSIPRLGRVGSQTTRGEVYIRYGRPLAWYYDPFGSGICADETVLPQRYGRGIDIMAGTPDDEFRDPAAFYGVRHLRIGKSRWIWRYRDFTLNFEDTFRNGDYTFPYEEDWSAYIYAYLEKRVPEIYESQIRKRMHVVLDALNFVDDTGRPGLKIVFACDTRGLKYQPRYEWPEGEFSIEIALLDSVYNRVTRSVFPARLRADSSVMYQTPYPLIGGYVTEAPAGSLVAAISIESKSNDAVGFTKDPVRVRRFGYGLAISDIELRFAEGGPPNPSHIYLTRGKAYVAFSIYNLRSGLTGTSEAEVSYRILGRKGAPSRFKRLVRLFLNKTEPYTPEVFTLLGSKYDLKTTGPRASQVIGIDLEPLSIGDYEIEISVTDNSSGASVTTRTGITIASELDL